MAEPIRFAVRLPHSWRIAGRDSILRIAELSDELDMDISVQDHLLSEHDVAPWGPPVEGDDRTVFEAVATLAFVAARTERARLIAGVFVLPFRHPIWLAKETATIDALSGGRLTVGAGVGALRGRVQESGQHLVAHGDLAAREFDAFKVFGHRGRMMDEYIRILDTLWTQEAATFEGEFYSFDGLDLLPRPVQRPRPPIWIGGRSLAAQVRAGRLADGWYPSQASVAVIEAGRPTVEAAAAEAGRPSPDFAVNLFIAIDPDRERAFEAMRVALGHRFAGDKPLFEQTIAGNPADVRARIEDYRRAGVRVFDLKYVPLTLDATIAQIRLMAAEVAPAFATT